MEEPEQAQTQRGVLGRRDFAEIRDLADVPQEPDVRTASDPVVKVGHCGQGAKRFQIVSFAGADEILVLRGRLEAADQRLWRSELEPVVAPLQFPERRESVLLDGLDHLRIERRRLAGHAERAVLGVAARAARDLRQLVRGEMPVAAAVELGQAPRMRRG